MDVGTAIGVFALIFVAELPDKTMIAMLVLGSRSRPALVWAGSTVAFAVHVTVAVLVGHALALLPRTWVLGVSAALFGAGAVYLLLVPERTEEERGEREAQRARSAINVAGGAFVVILVGEFGDLTQLLTANLAARSHDPLSVGVGAFVALAAVAAVAAFGGRAMLRVLPLAVIRRAGGVILLGFAAYDIYQLVHG
ncbi:MAG: TMEM165/GDT1 family protein [Actinomycetota bacterium]|nr:TMEM165/GDT1 family protein [Actinomycetota bacterium]